MKGVRLPARSESHAKVTDMTAANTYIGTVNNWAVVVLYPSPFMMVGKKRLIP
jgi:hypothetical protein